MRDEEKTKEHLIQELLELRKQIADSQASRSFVIPQSVGQEQTDHRRAHLINGIEEVLRESELFNRSIVNALSAHIAILDENGFILCTNRSWQVFAKSNELASNPDMTGVNYFSTCDRATGLRAEEAPVAAAGIREVISGTRDSFELEYPCHSPDEKRWFNMRVTRFKDQESPMVVVAHENITERKLAEEALARQNARIQAVLDSMPAGVALYEGEPLKPVLVNPMAEELLGRGFPAAIARGDLAAYFQAYHAGTDEFYPIESMPIIRAMSGESVSVDDMEIERPDGTRIRLEVFGAPVCDSAGSITGAVSIFRDITERKRVEEALRESEEKARQRAEELEKLMDLAPIVIWVAHDPQCLNITGNRAANILFEAEELENVSAGRPAGEGVEQRRFFRHGREVAAEELPMQYASLHGMEVQNQEIEALLPSGRRVTMLGSATPLLDNRGFVRGSIAGFMDITERKRAEEDARTQRQTLERIFESAPYIMMLVDKDGRVTKINRTGATFSGKPQEELLGLLGGEVFNCLNSLDGSGCGKNVECSHCPVRTRVMHTFQTGESIYNAEGCMTVRKGSTEVPVDMLISTVLVKDRDSDTVLVTIADITERRQAQKALRESEEQFRRLAESSADAIIRYDRECRHLYVNPTCERVTGIPAEEFIGRTHRQLGFGVEQSKEWDKRIRKVFDTAEPEHWDFEFESARGRMYFDWRVVPEFSEDGTVKTVLGVSRDITERVQVEHALRKSEERFRELAENIRDVFWVMTPDEVLYISPAYEEIWGRSCESLYENPASFMELVHPEDRVRVRPVPIVGHEGKAPYSEEYRIIRRDGTVRWIRARSFPILEQGRIVRTVGIAEDITTSKEAEEFLCIERDLVFGLGSSGSLVEGMKYLLKACLKFEGLDSGGIYLVESETGALKLICHQGLSEGFAERVSFFDHTSSKANVTMQGQSGYWFRPFGNLERVDLLEQEGLLAFLAIPVKSEGKVVALLNLGSHVQPEIPRNVRVAFEVIAAHIGGIISRVRLGDTVKAQGERLHEANAALRVLLKQREEDRTELEESLLKNVKLLITPYLEKLKRSRLAGDQRNFLEIMESHLQEITSPFVHKISARMLGLTPTEIRVADLIRQGKHTKEMADLLGISERAVIFHRQGIRRKFDMTGKKLNLQTYLGTLQ
ncbi:hypothetical protein SBDP1_1130005 [Syntrophobacter sp. SbD1]|nr:hypothetical protein SBDP1_1130005 [Syntrophobacter sp. SbD1]